jgi:hypothetical protein
MAVVNKYVLWRHLQEPKVMSKIDGQEEVYEMVPKLN